MKINIKFAKATADNKQQELSKEEKKYFNLLLNIPKFIEFVYLVRSKCSIPKNGIFDNWPISNKQLKSIDFAKIMTISLNLVRRQGLVNEWALTFICLFLDLPLTKHIPEDEPINAYQKNDSVFIEVKSYISNTELSNTIRKDKELKRLLGKLPKKTMNIGRKNISRDLMLKNNYEKLRNNGGKMQDAIDLYEDSIGPLVMIPEEARVYVSRLEGYFEELFDFKFSPLLHAVTQQELDEQLRNKKN